MDNEFTDAEIRALLRKAASDRHWYEIRQRLERAGDLQDESPNEAITEVAHETPLRALTPAR